MNSLILSNEKQLNALEGDTKAKEKRVKVTPEDLEGNDNNPFNSSIIEESIVPDSSQPSRTHVQWP